MCDHGLDEVQGLSTQDFTKHFSEISKADARILKQQRLLRGELAAQSPNGLQPAPETDEDGEKVPARRRASKGKKGGKAPRPPG